jgi:site-specific DNA-methyltransferase (adenine-specific)
MSFTDIDDGRARLWHGRNTDMYDTINGVDHVIVDPPYGKFTHTQQRNTRAADGSVTVVPIPFGMLTEADRDALVTFCKTRVLGWAVVFCEAEQTGMWRATFDGAGCKGRPPAIWVKPDAQPNFSGNGPGVGCEHIALAWCGEGQSKWNGGGKTGVYTHVKRHTGSHPTEKPLRLMRDLIRDFSNPGDLIFDPFMGSGSTGVAALELGRRFIGAEMNDDYFAIACQRIEAASKVVSILPDAKPQPVALFEGSQYRRAGKRAKEKA